MLVVATALPLQAISRVVEPRAVVAPTTLDRSLPPSMVGENWSEEICHLIPSAVAVADGDACEMVHTRSLDRGDRQQLGNLLTMPVAGW